MRGIQEGQFRNLRDDLQKLLQEENFALPCEHVAMIAKYQEELNTIYNDYRAALDKVAWIVKQFDAQKISIRKVIIHHKKCRKQVSAIDLRMQAFLKKKAV